MTEVLYNPKIKPEHLARKAIVYLRQSSEKQVRQNKESQLLQYAVAERVRALGWKRALPPLSAKASSVCSAWWHWERWGSSAAGRSRGRHQMKRERPFPRALLRNRKFADSSLEGSGFEPPVPQMRLVEQQRRH